MSKLIFTILLSMPLTALSQTATYFCDYDKYSDVSGIHKVEGGFSLTFLVNRESNEGYLVGNNGSAKVALIVADGQVSFIEITKSGNVMSATIDSENIRGQ